MSYDFLLITVLNHTPVRRKSTGPHST